MFNISISDICKICNGTAFNCCDESLEPKRIVIDSRDVSDGDLFAAFVGEKTDGHSYISSACANGAVCCLVEYIPDNCNSPCIKVNSVEQSIAELALYIRSQISLPIVGITGSVGKTTAKEMISAVLQQSFNVLKTEKNLNNQLGVPITISRINKENSAAVVEMGVSKIGDMKLLGGIVRPTVAVFTNIGHAHLEFLHNLEGVFKEKTSMLDFMEDSGVAIINNDDIYLKNLQCKQRKISYGIETEADVTASNIEYSPDGCGSSFVINYENESFSVYVPAFGTHIVYAALMAAAVGYALDMNSEQIRKGLLNFKTVGRRADVHKFKDLTLIDDCYNANPDSVKSSIRSMNNLSGRKVCILGDMLELGDKSADMHRDIGEFAAKNKADFLILAGSLSKYTFNGALSNGCKAVWFESRDELLINLFDLIKPGDVVLVKASFSSRFDKVSEKIKERFSI